MGNVPGNADEKHYTVRVEYRENKPHLDLTDWMRDFVRALAKACVDDHSFGERRFELYDALKMLHYRSECEGFGCDHPTNMTSNALADEIIMDLLSNGATVQVKNPIDVIEELELHLDMQTKAKLPKFLRNHEDDEIGF